MPEFDFGILDKNYWPSPPFLSGLYQDTVVEIAWAMGDEGGIIGRRMRPAGALAVVPSASSIPKRSSASPARWARPVRKRRRHPGLEITLAGHSAGSQTCCIADIKMISERGPHPLPLVRCLAKSKAFHHLTCRSDILSGAKPGRLP